MGPVLQLFIFFYHLAREYTDKAIAKLGKVPDAGDGGNSGDGGDSSGSCDCEFATDEEVEAMLDSIFGKRV